LNVALLAFAAGRGGIVAMAVLAHASPWLIAGLVLPCIAGLVAAIAIWLGRHMEGSLLLLGFSIVAASAVQMATLGSVAVPGALGQVTAALLSIAGLIFLLRHMPEGE
jgi:hypothetical protein